MIVNFPVTKFQHHPASLQYRKSRQTKSIPCAWRKNAAFNYANLYIEVNGKLSTKSEIINGAKVLLLDNVLFAGKES